VTLKELERRVRAVETVAAVPTNDTRPILALLSDSELDALEAALARGDDDAAAELVRRAEARLAAGEPRPVDPVST
jgi:predicted membrane-bound mannosyltransferase